MDCALAEVDRWMIIADFDGTIIDSETANYRALQQVLEEFEYVENRTTILRALAEGTEVEEMMKRFNVTSETKEKFEERMKSILTQISVPLLPGAKENIRILSDYGFLFSLVTDNYREVVVRIIHENGLSDVFDPRFILTIDTFPKRKPSPSIVKELMKRSGREKAIIIGNSPKEAAMALNSGYPAVIITSFNGIEHKAAKKKELSQHEWEVFGGISGRDIYSVKDWEEARNMIIEITQKKSKEE